MPFKNKKIAVLGAGISGVNVAQVLTAQGADVTLSDAKPLHVLKNKDFSACTACGIRLALGEQNEQLLAGLDYVVVSPGISIDIPLLVTARAQGIAVISEVEVAYRLCAVPVLAITGTNGKTTTTTLLGDMMKTSGQDVVVGGNIGMALSQEVLQVAADGIVVAEISSFQLEGCVTFKPHIAAVLNITPGHLDRHHTMENYIAMKERIFAQQTAQDYLVLNYDDITVREMNTRAASQVCYFSRQAVLASGVYLADGNVTIAWDGQVHTVCAVAEIGLRGGHNVENVLAATAIAFLAGVKVEKIAQTIREFTGVEHRIEFVKSVKHVAYYNDSKATNPESSVKALESFDGHILLIAGGRDKNTDLTEFMTLIKDKVDHLILLGEAAERFAEAARKHEVAAIHHTASLAEAVTLAHTLASEPQVVLLSPACASYDMFNSYEERGTIFKQLVEQL